MVFYLILIDVGVLVTGEICLKLIGFWSKISACPRRKDNPNIAKNYRLITNSLVSTKPEPIRFAWISSGISKPLIISKSRSNSQARLSGMINHSWTYFLIDLAECIGFHTCISAFQKIKPKEVEQVVRYSLHQKFESICCKRLMRQGVYSKVIFEFFSEAFTVSSLAVELNNFFRSLRRIKIGDHCEEIRNQTKLSALSCSSENPIL